MPGGGLRGGDAFLQEFHGAGAMALHAFGSLPFWLARQRATGAEQ